MLGRLRAPPPAEERVGALPATGETSAPAWFGPQGLVENPWDYWAAGAFAVGLVLVFLADLTEPKSVEAIPIALILVIASAWLLSTPLALSIAVLAIGLLAGEVAIRQVHPVTAAVEIVVFGVLATATRFYSTRLRSLLVGSDGDLGSTTAGVFGLENLAHLAEGSCEGIATVDRDGRIRYANAAAIELLGLGDQGPTPTEGLFERIIAKDRDRIRSDLDSPPTNGGAYLNFSVRGNDGSVRQVRASRTRVVVRGRPLTALVLRDVTDVNRFGQAAQALAETAAGLAVTQPLEQTLTAVARRVVEVTQACACAVFLLEEERPLRLAGSWGLPEGYEAAANRAARAGANLPVFEAIRTRTAVFVENLPERIRTESQFAGMRSVVQDVAWRLAIAFPMVHAGRPLGGLAVYFLPGQRPDEPTMDFLSAIAGQAASAAEISRLVSMGQREVATKERLQLSRELHDSLSQRLYGIILGARSIDMRLAGRAEEVAEPLAYILDLAQGGLTEMRDIVLQLRPDFLEKEGLIAALGQHADAISARHEVEVIKSLQAEPAVSLDTKLAAYRIALEALSNVTKHANAKHAWLRVAQDDGRLAIEVRDDGDGFDADEHFPGHFGLETMRERAGTRGGDLEIRTARGLGTTVVAWLPTATREPAVRA